MEPTAEETTAEQQLQIIEQDLMLYLGGERLRQIGAVHPLTLTQRLNMVFRSYAENLGKTEIATYVEPNRRYITP